MKKAAWWVAVLLSALASGASVAQSSPELGRYYIDASRATGDTASAWAIARLLDTLMADSPGSIDAARAARTAHPIGPDDAPALLAVRLSDKKLPFPDTDRAKALQSLLAAAADNAYFAVLLMSEPEFKADQETTDRLLRLAAHAPRFDGGYSARIAAMYDRLSALPMPPPQAGEPVATDPEDLQLIMAVTLTAMDGGPAWTTVFRRCKAATGPMQDDCRAFGVVVLDDADTLMDTLMGAALLRVTATTPEQRALAESARRTAMWRQEAGNPTRRQSASDDRRDQALYRKALFAKNELAALDAVLQSRGLPLQPPADWTSRYSAGK